MKKQNFHINLRKEKYINMKKLILTLISSLIFVNTSLSQINTITVNDPIEKPAINNADGKFCFAKVLETDIDFLKNATKFSSHNIDIYKLIIYSENAFSLGFYFTILGLDSENELFVYNADSSSYIEPITLNHNTLRTSQVSGDSIFIELHVEKNSEPKTLKIKKVYYDFLGITGIKNSLKKIRFENSSCSSEVDINCDEGFDYQDIKHSVLKYSFEENNMLYMCTGTLINNYQNDGTPYVLTAAHCICSKEIAETVVAYFNYEKISCGSKQATAYKTIEGASLVATAPKTMYTPSFGRRKEVPEMDFSLLKLSSTPTADYEPYYAGFTVSEDEGLENVACIHHPNGDYKKISISKSVPYVDTYPNEDDETNYDLNCHWHIAEWTVGTTETGSSGSALFNSSKKLIGILSGGYASCTDPVNDYFQMFSKAWDSFSSKENQLKYWLAGGSGITQTEAYDPYNITTNYRKSEILGSVNADTTAVTLSWQTAKTSSFDSGFEDFEKTEDIENVFLANVNVNGQSTAWILQNNDFQAFEGKKCIASFTSTDRATNDYLTLPKLAISSSDVLTFAAKSVGGISTLKLSQNTKPSRYQQIEEISVPEEWTEYSFPLTNYAGNSIYLNFNNITPTGNSTALLLDNIKIDKDASIFAEDKLIGYRLYCNNELIKEFSETETYTYNYEVKKETSYTFYVLNVYENGKTSGIGNAVTFDFRTQKETPVSDLTPKNQDIVNVLYPNPATEKISFKSSKNFQNAKVEIINSCGITVVFAKIEVLNADTPYEFSVNGLKSGVYIFRITDKNNKITKKFMVK